MQVLKPSVFSRVVVSTWICVYFSLAGIVWAGSSQSPDLQGEYWFVSLSANPDTHLPLSKRGELTISGDQWHQVWDEYAGSRTFSSTFSATVQPDGSIKISFPNETYNVAWNGDLMIHAGIVLAGGGQGIDIFARKASSPNVNDVVGNHGFFGHFLDWSWPSDSCIWGNALFEQDGTSLISWTNDKGIAQSESLNWTLDEGRSVIDAQETELFLGEGGVAFACHVVPEPEKGDVGYNVFIKKTDQAISMTDMAGTYQVRFLETGPGGVPFTCGQGLCVLKGDGSYSVDAYFSDGEHNVSTGEFSVGFGNSFAIDGFEGIISPKLNLMFAPEYQYKNPPTRREHDWLGGIFLVRVQATQNTNVDFNGDGTIDHRDLFMLADLWLQSGSGIADIAPPPDGDGVVDFNDFAIFAQYWISTSTLCGSFENIQPVSSTQP